MKKIEINKIADRVSIRTVLVLSFALLIVSMAAHWKFIASDPEVVFRSMVKNSLQTNSVTKTIESGDDSDRNRQIISLRFSPSVGVEANYEIEKTQNDTRVYTKTNVIGTRDADYIKYAKIETPEVSKEKIRDIEGVWAKVGGEKNDPQRPSVFNDAVFSIILFANLGDKDADELVAKLIDGGAYKILDGENGFNNGKAVSTINVQVFPKKFVETLKLYGEKTGYVDTAGLESESFSDQSVDIQVKVDLASRQLQEISYSGGSKVEKYASHGQYSRIVTPDKTISFIELSSKLQNAK